MKIITIQIFIFFYSCQEDCKNRLDILYGDINARDTVKLTIDDSLKKDKIFDKFHIPHIDKGYVIEGYCPKRKNVKIDFEVNSKDTTVYIDPNRIKKCYLGYHIKAETRDTTFVLYYSYRSGFTGQDEIRFEDF